MAATEPTKSLPDKEIQIPEWEHSAVTSEGTAQKRPKRSAGQSFSAKLNAILPPHRRYLRRSRKTFLWILLAVILALLALIIGLAVGLTRRSKSTQNLPLPSSSQSFTGDLTYFGVGLGACGFTNGDNDDIVSVSHLLFDAAGSSTDAGGNSNRNPLCSHMLRAERFDEEVGERRSVDLKVVDRCTGCAADDLDTSLGVFEKLAPSASGRVDVTWAWLPAATGK